ncbi:protein wech-like [Mytilus edulis]|uniref:protein wech-like n=1 Tax=Mytilus edulis TaxID=6550 RepID=UPI0039EE8C09
MATSGISTSIRKAKVPLSCYFCKGPDIKWKCDDCGVHMCNSCKVTVHQGPPSKQDNDVVSKQDINKTSPGFQEVTSVVIASVCNSYTTTLPAVYTLLCSNDDLIYFHYNTITSDNYQFVKGKLLKSSIKILQTSEKQIFDFTIMKDGEILLKEFGGNTIQLVSLSGEVKTVLDTFPMRPLAIHVNKDNEVIVGLREQGPPFPVQDFSVRQVILFGSDYKRKVTLEFDKEGNKLFSYANRIRTDSRNVVYVIDRFDNANRGRIVAVAINGRLKFTYDGPKDLGTFQPEGITITPSYNIVVADYYNKALHVINSKGDLLGLQFIFKDLDINYPSSVCFDTEGYLLIGCCRGENEEFGKIHVVKILDSLM